LAGLSGYGCTSIARRFGIDNWMASTALRTSCTGITGAANQWGVNYLNGAPRQFVLRNTGTGIVTGVLFGLVFAPFYISLFNYQWGFALLRVPGRPEVQEARSARVAA
jgi:hypothetical protein